MFKRLIENRFRLPLRDLGKLAQLSFFALSITFINVIAYITGLSLFLTNAGTDRLPIAYIIIGLASIPIYTRFSKIVDRVSRPQLFRYLLIIAILLVIVMRLFSGLDILLIYFFIFIYFSFQWDLYLSILFPSLVSDYFTSLDWKRYTPLLTMAQAIGGLLGGGVMSLLVSHIATQNILLIIPCLYLILIFQLLYLERSQPQIETNTSETKSKILEDIKTFPLLVKRYPIIFFLAASSFIFIIVFTLAEFLNFTIYAQVFTNEQELTAFLGLLSAINNILQLSVLYFFTRPLIQRLGVNYINLIYPITTLASFIALALNFKMPAAIYSNINFVALDTGINQPVYSLNYNAVPHRFVGRVRALSSGLFYSIGLSVAGLFLLIFKSILTPLQITWIGIGLSVIFLALRYLMGKSYLRSLITMLRSGAINLDNISEGLKRLPIEYTPQIQQLLTSGDRNAQILGLELSTRLKDPSQVSSEIEVLFQDADAGLRRAIVKLFSTAPKLESIRHFEHFLESSDETRQAMALEVLIACRQPISNAKLQTLIASNNQEVRGLACVAAIQNNIADEPQIQTACKQLYQSDLDNNTVQALVRSISISGSPELIFLLKQILNQASTEVKRETLNALATTAHSDDLTVKEIAASELNHPDAAVRSAAFNLLKIVRSPEMLIYIATGLEDIDLGVRLNAATALASYGEQSLSLAKDYLQSPRSEVVEAAIAAIGNVQTKHAEDILFHYISQDFHQLTYTLQWQQQIPAGDRTCAALLLAITDFHQRLIQRVLYILSCLGHYNTLNSVKSLLYATDKRGRANAVETLASLSQRRFVLPLMPLLEQLVNGEPIISKNVVNAQWLSAKNNLLFTALKSQDRWLKITALLGLINTPDQVPLACNIDTDPVAQSVAKYVCLPAKQRPSAKEFLMNRILLLKNLPLFTNLSLDELLLIDNALEQEEFLAGETIFEEGSVGTHFYIIAEGRVLIVKQIDGQQRELTKLSVGQHFGEIALFDNSPRSASSIAAENCTLLKLEQSRFISLISQRPQIVLEICKFLSQRLRDTDKYRAKGSAQESS